MAYVKQLSIHTTPNKAINYIKKEEKTEDMKYVTSFSCSTETDIAYKEFNVLKKQFGKEDGILAHHFIQSFKHGEIDEETAHKMGKEWAEIFLGDNYQYIVCTYNDTEHIHNQIIVNSVGFDGKKYNACRNSLEDIRAYSDVLCRKYGLSIINNKYNNRTMSYKEWLENKNKTSWKQNTREDIDYFISVSNNFDDFIQKMRNKGYEIKQGDNVKHMTFKHPEMKRQVRGKTLGADYSEESIRKRIELKEHDFKTLSTKRYKYKIKKDKWNYAFKMVSYNHSSLQVNVLLISILLSLIFNKNENYQNHNRYHEAQKSIAKEVDKLSLSLNIINKYDFKTRGDIDEAIQKVNRNIENKKGSLGKLENLNTKADAVCTEITLYRKYRKYNEEYKQIILKGAYKKKHEYELEKFESCKKRLETFGLKSESEYQEFEKQRDNIFEKMEVIKKQIYEDYSELEQIESIKNTLDKDRRKKLMKDITLEEKNNYNKDKTK